MSGLATTHVMRVATEADLPALYEMAKLTGGGFTNLPPDRKALAAKLARSAEAVVRPGDGRVAESFVLVLEEIATGEVRGTCQIFTQVGAQYPFYSYRIGTLTQHSQELNRTFRADMLSLTTDLEGSSEVGGLFLHPAARAGGLGLLIARSRYLFIRNHRERFGPNVIAELRGVIDESGGSPFWDGLAGKFFGMNFQEADTFNATHGHQFIADLMPKHPIYIAMLPETARAVISLPHPTGRAAMRMLENEGFVHDGYIDIFDGGPTMRAQTDHIRTVAEGRCLTITEVAHNAAPHAIAATGRLADFRAVYARVTPEGVLAPEAAEALNVSEGDTLLVAPQ